MAYTFDGANKLIILSTGTVSFTVVDLYSRWKDWLVLSDNSKYEDAMGTTGGDPLPGGTFLGQTFFLENDWKIRPQEANHTLTVIGNLYDRSGGSPFASTLGTFTVRIEQKTSNVVDLVATGSVDPDSLVDRIFNKSDTVLPGWNFLRAMQHALAALVGENDGLGAEGGSTTYSLPESSTPAFSGTVDIYGNRSNAEYHV